MRRLRLLCVLVVLGSLCAALPAYGANPQPWPDAVDAGKPGFNGPDITGVTFSHTAEGRLTFRVELSNRTTHLFQNENLGLYLDVDGVSEAQKIDYWIRVYGATTPGGMVMEIVRWDGAFWSTVASPSFTPSFTNGLTVTIDRADLGKPRKLVWFASAGVGNTVYDYVPDNAASATGRVTYHVDRDGDGVLETFDDCAMVKAGPWDPNKNGCAGPYKKLRPQIATDYRTSSSYNGVKLRQIILRGRAGGTHVLPPGAVTLRVCTKGRCLYTFRLNARVSRSGDVVARTPVLKYGAPGPYHPTNRSSTACRGGYGWCFRAAGTVLTVRVTVAAKRGYHGFFQTKRILAHSIQKRPVATGCIPASAVTRCRVGS